MSHNPTAHTARPEEQAIVHITINGHRVRAVSEATILQTAREHDIDIPALCADPRLKPKGSCGICVVEVTGRDELVQACGTKVAEGMDVTTESERISASRKRILDEMLSNHNAYCEPPCRYACPAGIDIPGYIRAIAEGDNAKCIAIVKERLPLPRIIGRVCPRPCQDACRRVQVDGESVMICQLKRFAGDSVAADGTALPEILTPATGKQVAVVGSGPSGLSAAYYLAKSGHRVVIFEAKSEAGGMMRTAIPSYRLPKNVVDEEIKEILDLGVELKLNAALGGNFSLDDLRREHDAAYLAVGAQKGSLRGLDNAAAAGLLSAVDFLRQANNGAWRDNLGQVVVIGGGHTALDAARTSLRLGASQVTVAYRRTAEEMPAAHELEEGGKEGVNYRFLCAPIGLERHDGKVAGVRFQEMELGEPDESGRRRPVPVRGAQFGIEADTVIMAIGQDVQLEGFDGTLALDENGTIKTNPLTLETNIAGVFAGGDCDTGPATIVEAIAAGRRAATAIDAFVRQESSAEACLNPLNGLGRPALKFFDIAAKPKSAASKQVMPEIPLKERRSFAEIETGFTAEQAAAEAGRCLQCICHQASDCKLQTYSIQYEAGSLAYRGTAGEYEPYDGSPLLELDRKRCIKCHNCVRICDEVQQQHVYRVGDDEYPALKGTDYRDAGCVFCGQCVSACPTGALKDLSDRGVLRQDLRQKRETTCPYCGVGCRFEVQVEGDKVVAVQADVRTKGVNKGNLCVKGRFGFSFHDHPDRLKKPLVRESLDQDFREASWDEALKYTAGRLLEIKRKYGPQAMGVLTSSRGLNEENYAAQKFYRTIIGTNNIDNCARVCHAPSVAGLYRAFGSGAATNSMDDIANADLLFVIGSNTTEAHPIAGIMIRQAVSAGAKLIVADPRKLELVEQAKTWLPLRAGTNVALLNGFLNVIINEGLIDEDFISARTENFELVRAIVKHYTPEFVEAVTGVDADALRQAAGDYAAAERALIVYGLGVTEHRFGSFGVMCLANLAMATGNVGRPGAGILVLRGQNNVQGSCDMGALPEYLTGYQRVDDPDARAKFASGWGADLPDGAGLKEPEMYRAAISGDFKALHVIGYDPVKTQANLNFVNEGFDKLEFVVVQDIFLTKTAEKAHVVLPAACYFEKEGTFTNAERRVQRVRRVIQAPEGLKSDWEIIADLARAMGADFHFEDAARIMDEIALLTPQYHGVNFERLENEELCWPVWDTAHEGTPLLHHGNFTKGKGTFHDIPYHPSAEVPDDEFPLLLTTGRRLYHYSGGSMTFRTPIMRLSPEEWLEIHPEDAKKFGLKDDEPAVVASRRGEVTVKTRVTKRSRPGTVFLSFHFDDVLTNLITGPGEDELALTPEYKVCAVKVRRAR